MRVANVFERESTGVIDLAFWAAALGRRSVIIGAFATSATAWRRSRIDYEDDEQE